MGLSISLLAVMAAVVGLGIREVWLYRAQRAEYPLRRLTIRLANAAMMLILLGSILIGVRVFGLNEPDGIVPYFMLFWGCITLLTGAILCLVIADFRTIGEETTSDSVRLWHDIAETIAAHEQQPPKE